MASRASRDHAPEEIKPFLFSWLMANTLGELVLSIVLHLLHIALKTWPTGKTSCLHPLFQCCPHRCPLLSPCAGSGSLRAQSWESHTN